MQGIIGNFQHTLQTSDLNRDGTIDRNELIQALVRAATPWQLAQSMSNEVFSNLDKNRDGRLSVQDVSAQVNHIARQPQTNISHAAQQVLNGIQQSFQQALQASDTNRDGTIDNNELIQTLMRAATPWHVAKNIAGEIFLKLDKNRDGRLSIQDVSQQIPNIRHHINSTNPAVEQIISGFRQNFQQSLQTTDLNRDGSLDFNEIFNVLVRTGAPHSAAQSMTQEIFQKLDINHDSRISIQDIAQQVNNSSTLDHNLRTKMDQTIQMITSNFQNMLRQSDLNRDSLLDSNELVQLLVRSNIPWNSANTMANEIFQRLDKNRDGRLSVQDIAPQIPQSTHHSIRPSMTYSQIYQLFLQNLEQAVKVTDLNQDGMVNQNELTNILVRANAPLQTAQSLSTFLFQQLDKNRDGWLSIHDIKTNAPNPIRRKPSLPLGRNLSLIGQGRHPATYSPFSHAGNSDVGGSQGWFDVYANSTEKWIELLHEGGGEMHRVDDIYGGYRFIAFMFKALFPSHSYIEESKFRLSLGFSSPTEEEAVNLMEALLMGSIEEQIDLPDWNNEQSYLVEYYMVPLLSQFTIQFGHQALLRIMDKNAYTYNRQIVESITRCADEFKTVFEEGKTDGLRYNLVQWSDPTLALIGAAFLLVMEGMMEITKLQTANNYSLAKIRNGAKTIRACLDGISTDNTSTVDIIITGVEIVAISAITVIAVATAGAAAAAVIAAVSAGVGAGGLVMAKYLIYKFITGDNADDIQRMERDMKTIMEKILNMFGSHGNSAYLNDPEISRFVTPEIRSRIQTATNSGMKLDGGLIQHMIGAFHWGIDFR
jgi:Ca2+-binding EF-hand superfamily protein